MKLYIQKYLTFVLILISAQLFAQTTWQTAETISHNSTTTITSSNTTYWFSLVAVTSELILVAGPADSTSGAAITTLELYELNGSNSLTLLQSENRDTTVDFSYKNTVIGNTYYIKGVNSDPSEPWKLWSTETPIIIYDDDYCAPPCSNLLFNGDFETSSNKVIQTGQVPNFCQLYPFKYQVLDLYGFYTPATQTYQNLVCHWNMLYDVYHNVPGEFARIGLTNANIGSGTYYAHLRTEGCYDLKPEPIYNSIHLEAGVTYNISFNYAVNSVQTGYVLKFGFSPYANPTNLINVDLIPGTYNSSIWGPAGTTFYATKDYESLVIYPSFPLNSSCNTIDLYIDDIVITPVLPPLEKPIISGPSTTCDPDQFGDIIYTITNYDPTYVYRYTINGVLPEKIAHSNTFTINVSDLSNQVNTIWIENGCESKSMFVVYECCKPVGYTVFADEELTDLKVIPIALSSKKMVINGTVNVSENISLTNFDIKFGPMAKLIIDDGNDFIMNGGTLEDGCDYPWDGIYIDNSDPTTPSKLKLNDVDPIKGAFNAVVSSNNAETEITNSTFVNNDIGVKVRNYKPHLCDAVPLGQPPIVVPPYLVTIVGNTFEKTADIFPIFGEYYGIQIDTVYDITIGDENATKNTFKKVHIGIKTNSSWVKLFNNRFEDITNGSNQPILTWNNKPKSKIAVLAEKLIVPSNQTTNYPIPYSNECTASKIIVGKSGTNGGNEFVNCDFGIYSYKHYTEVINNVFTSQRCNAVWIWDGRSKVNDNSIQQKAATWFTNATLNIGILVEKTSNPAPSYDIQIAEVKDNTITNTRTGISLIHCSSMPFNSSIKTVVKDNTITFNNYITPSSSEGYKYTGIWISACNRSVVYGNKIENISGATINSTDSKAMIGIRVDKTYEAQVSHNFDLNYLGSGIWINGDCHNTQFFCNIFKACKKGIYTFTPSIGSGYAAVISDQGNLAGDRPQDNFFQQMQGPSVSGYLSNNTLKKWYYRIGNTGFVIPDVDNHNGLVLSNPQTSCTNGIIPPPDPNDYTYAAYIDEMYGDIVRNELEYTVLEEEFEYFEDEYLYEVLYSNPEIMNLGEPDDTAYSNFYNYLTNSNVREFIDVQELIDENNINQALMDNGIIVAQNVIEANKQYINEVYLSSFAQDKYFTESQSQTLYTIAMLTPYIGGDAVYSARVMLGINPNTYNLAYRQGNFPDSSGVIIEDNILKTYPNPTKDVLTLEFVYPLETSSLFTIYDLMGRKVLEILLDNGNSQFFINTSVIENGVYFYSLSTDDKAKGKIIINN